jgi:integrase
MGGLKTDAGRNRIVPIHPVIWELVQKNYDWAKEINSTYLFNDEYGQQGTYMTYDKYRRRFDKVMKRLNLEHRPHDTRHTFVTKAKAAGMDEYILKLIVGHAIKDITEKIYTHRTIEDMQREIKKIK